MGVPSARTSRVPVAIAWAASLLVAIAATWWATTLAVGAADIDTAGASVATIEVQQGTLGRTLALPVVAQWEVQPLAEAPEAGTLTEVTVSPGDEVSAGDVLFSRDLRPTVIAQGVVPSFRDLRTGDRGDDVIQLQDFLRQGGWLARDAAGAFDWYTAQAVREWQRSIGTEVTGQVRSGDIVYAAQLPTRIVLAENARVGARVAPGDVIVWIVAPAPTFTVDIDTSTGIPIGVGSAVTVSAGTASWAGVLASARAQSGSTVVTMTIEAPDGTAVCADQCQDAVPIDSAGSPSIFSGALVVTPDISGAQVPAASVMSDAQGNAFVTGAEGERIMVSVLITDQGQSIVEGVTPGTRIRVTPETE